MDINKAVASLRLNGKEHLTTHVSNSMHSTTLIYTIVLCGPSFPLTPEYPLPSYDLHP